MLMITLIILFSIKINFNLIISDENNFKTIIVEGLIGCGKSTFLNYLNTNPIGDLQIETFKEPINNWRNVESINIFQLFANDMSRWSFLFQVYMQLSQLKMHRMKPISESTKYKIMERSIFSSHYCFVENLLKNNFLEREEYVVLNECFKYLIETDKTTSIDLILYLRIDPSIAYDRIKSRDREEEKDISLEYLKSLNDCHENWLTGRDNHKILPAPVIIIDANKEINEMENEYKKLLKLIFK